MKQISSSEVLSAAWERTKQHWAVVLGILIVIYIIQQIVASIFGPSQNEIQEITNQLQNGNFDADTVRRLMNLSGPNSFLSEVVSKLLEVGLIVTLLNIVRKNIGEFSIDAWKQPADVYLKYLVIELVCGIITGIGYVCCIVPGLFLQARLQFAGIYLLEHPKAGIGEAINASWNMSNGNTASLILLIILYFLLCVAGLLCCCVGVILAAIVIHLAVATAYTMLCPEATSQTETTLS